MRDPAVIFQSLCVDEDWALTPDCPYLEGHFPGNPILPGYSLIEATQYLLSRDFGFDGPKAARLDFAKFKKPIRPGDKLRVSIIVPQKGAEEGKGNLGQVKAKWYLAASQEVAAEIGFNTSG